MNSRKKAVRTTTRAYTEGGGPNAACAAINNQALIRLIGDSDEVVLRVPGADKVPKAIRCFGAELQHLLRAARLGESEAPGRDEADLSLTLHRLEIAFRAQRHPLAGRVIRRGPGGPRVTAVVVLAPTRVDRCTYRLAA